MERSYLNAWTRFSELTKTMIPKIEMLLAKNPNDFNGLVSALRGLSACKYEAQDLRNKLVEMANKVVAANDHKNQTIYTQALVDGLVGLS